MKYQTIGSTDPTYTPPNPIDPATPLPGAQPLPAGATVDVGLVTTDGWDLEQFGKFVGTGADVAARVGIDLGPVAGFDFAGAFSTIARFAAGGALLGGGAVGAVIGAIVGIVSTLSGAWAALQDPNWYQVGPGVHDFATAYCEQEFIEEAQRAGTNTWPDVLSLVKAQLAWWMARYGAVLTGQGGRFYSGVNDWVYLTVLDQDGAYPIGQSNFYGAAGVDWVATREARGGDDANKADNQRDDVQMYNIQVKSGPADPSEGDGSNINPIDGGGVWSGPGNTTALAFGGLLVGVLLLASKDN